MAGVVGRTSRKSDKLWRDQLIIAAKRTADETIALIEDPKAPMLAKAAAKCVGAAVGGDIQAMKEIGDRIDGKPKQQTELSGPDGEALPLVTHVHFRE